MKSCLGLICLIGLSAVFTETGLQCEAITVIPNAIVTLINDSTYFNCSTTSNRTESEWMFHSENLHQAVIYSYGTIKPLFQDRFRVEKYANDTEKQFNLIIEQVTKDDAGRYTCRNPDSQEDGEAQLTVIGTEPVCDSNLNADGPTGPTSCAARPEMVQLSCSVRYSGKQAPELQFMRTDKGIVVDTSRLDCSDVGNRYTCNLWIKSNAPMNETSYVCQTKGSRTRQYHCKWDVLGIIHALGANTELFGSLRDKVNCSVEFRSQPCTYSWNFNDGIVNRIESRDQVIELKSPGRFTCEVSCPIRNTNCTFTTMVVKVKHVEQTSANAAQQDDGNTNIGKIVIPVVVLVAAAAAAVIGTIIFVIIKRKKKKKLNVAKQPQSAEGIPLVENAGGSAVEGDISAVLGTIKKEHRVRGLTILHNELFVASEMCSTISVFTIDSLIYKRNLACDKSSIINLFSINATPSREFEVNDLLNPGTIAACVKNSCLYIMDQAKKNRPEKIFRVNPDGTGACSSWDTKGEVGRISVNQDGNIVMTVYDKHTLRLYDPTGKIVTDRKLDSSDPSLMYIFHALGLSDGNFIISHGTDTAKESKLHRVCMINAAGEVLRSFGNERGSGNGELNSPAYLVERKDGSILVADQKNNRIILLNSKLEFETVLFTKEKDYVSLPEAMCVYEETNPPLLFLGCNKKNNGGGYLIVLKLD